MKTGGLAAMVESLDCSRLITLSWIRGKEGSEKGKRWSISMKNSERRKRKKIRIEHFHAKLLPSYLFVHIVLRPHHLTRILPARGG